MNKFRYMAVAFAVAGSMALAGCGAHGAASGSMDSKDNKLEDINAHPRSDIKDGGTLRFAIEQLPTDNWNVLNVNGNLGDDLTIHSYTSPTNFDFDKKGVYKPNKNFLLGYDKQDPKDGKGLVVTLHLNPKAVWNDKTPITWKDYEATIMHVNDKAYEYASTDGFDQVVSVTKGKTDFDVVVTFKAAYPDWAAVLSGPLHRDAMRDANTFNTAQSGTTNEAFHNEWQSGPFALDKIDAAAKTITLKRNPLWWGDKPKLETLSFKELDAKAECAGFANSEVDVASNLISNAQYQACSKRPDGQIRAALGLQWRHFTINSRAGVFKDLKVRQAVQLATNRKTIAKSDMVGLPVNLNDLMLGNHLFMPGQAGYVDNGKAWEFNLKKAGKLLDEAGWKLSADGKSRQKDGQTLSAKYLMIPGLSTSENEGKLLQSSLSKIGFDLKMQPIESKNFFSNGIIPGNFEITAFTWVATDFPMMNIGQIYGTGSNSNYSGLSVPALDKVISQVAVESDHKKRVDLANKADRMIWENVFNIPIYRRMDFNAVPKNLANYGSFGLASARVEDIGYLK